MSLDKTRKHILIMAGGTGGHVFPGLAVAQKLIDEGHEVSWLGTATGIEAELVPKSGITLNIIDIQGVRGKGAVGLLQAPFKILHALVQSLKIINRIKPDCVLGMGGFAAGPGGIIAKLKGIPLLVHEQNAVAGTTNVILSKIATQVLQAFPNAFAHIANVRTVGNPVRSSIKPIVKQYNNSTVEKLNVLVLGGSLGAKAINEVLPPLLNVMLENIQVWHQAGKRHIDTVMDLYEQADLEQGEHLRIDAFIDDMSAAYAWADIVICRSGAMTVSELAVAALPAVFIPFPYAIDDHQTANAKWMADDGAAILLEQNEMTVDSLKNILSNMYNDKERLKTMQVKAGKLGIDNAAEQVATVCLELSL